MAQLSLVPPPPLLPVSWHLLTEFQTATRLIDAVATMSFEVEHVLACAAHHVDIGDHGTALLLYRAIQDRGMAAPMKSSEVNKYQRAFADTAIVCGELDLARTLRQAVRCPPLCLCVVFDWTSICWAVAAYIGFCRL